MSSILSSLASDPRPLETKRAEPDRSPGDPSKRVRILGDGAEDENRIVSVEGSRGSNGVRPGYDINGDGGGEVGSDDEHTESDLLLRQLSSLPQPDPIHLSFWRKLIIASGHVLNDLCASLWFTYALLYFDKVVGFNDPLNSTQKNNYAAIIILIGQVVDGLATPLVGYEADQTISCWLCNHNYGRCKSWHLIGSVLAMGSFPFVFSACIGCTASTANWVKLLYYIPFVVIFQIGWASVQISHLALIPKMHPDDIVRTDILAKRYGFTVCANIAIFLMTWFTLGNGTNCKISSADSTNFMQIGLSAIGLGALFTLAFHLGVKEEPDHKIKRNVAVINSRTELIRRLSQSVEHEDVAILRVRTRSRTESLRSRKSVVAQVIAEEDRIERNRVGDFVPDSDDVESGRALLDSGSIEDGIAFSSDGHGINKDEGILARLNSKTSYFSTKSLTLGKDKMTLKEWFCLPQFYIVALIYMSTRLSVNLGQVFVSYFVQYSLWLPCNTVATVPLTMFLSGLFVSFGIKFLNKHLGRQIAYLISAFLTIIGAGLVLGLPWDGPNQTIFKDYIIYVVAALLGGGSSGILITSLSITADMIGNNVENGAFVYGAMSFCDKLSCGLTIVLIDGLKPCEYNDEDPNIPPSVTAACRIQITSYYRHVLGFSTGGCAFVGILACGLLTYRLHYQNQQQKRLAELSPRSDSNSSLRRKKKPAHRRSAGD